MFTWFRCHKTVTFFYLVFGMFSIWYGYLFLFIFRIQLRISACYIFSLDTAQLHNVCISVHSMMMIFLVIISVFAVFIWNKKLSGLMQLYDFVYLVTLFLFSFNIFFIFCLLIFIESLSAGLVVLVYYISYSFVLLSLVVVILYYFVCLSVSFIDTSFMLCSFYFIVLVLFIIANSYLDIILHYCCCIVDIYLFKLFFAISSLFVRLYYLPCELCLAICVMFLFHLV